MKRNCKVVARDPIAHGELFLRSSSFDLEAVLKDRLIDTYNDKQWVPDDLPVSVVPYRNWHKDITVFTAILVRGRSDNALKARGHMGRIAYERLFRIPNEIPVLPSHGFDLVLFRTLGEVPYGRGLAKDLEDTYVYTGTIHLYQDLMFWARAIIRLALQSLRRSSQYAFLQMLRIEQKQRF